MRLRPLNPWEVAAALLFAGLGGFMIWEAGHYPYGSVSRMGPGFFPVWIGVALIGLGLGLVLEVRRLATLPSPAMRPLVAIPSSLLVFALAVETVGLVPATAASVAIAALGDRPFRPRAMLGTVAAVSAVAGLVPLLGIGPPLDAFRW